MIAVDDMPANATVVDLRIGPGDALANVVQELGRKLGLARGGFSGPARQGHSRGEGSQAIVDRQARVLFHRTRGAVPRVGQLGPSWPGLGLLFFESVTLRDYPVVLALTVFSATLTLAGNLGADLLYRWANPQAELGRT